MLPTIPRAEPPRLPVFSHRETPAVHTRLVTPAVTTVFRVPRTTQRTP